MTNHKMPRNVIFLGLTSFFTDVSTEMIYPLLQAFVTMVLAAKTALVGPVLGIIEGVAESTAGLLKLFSGYYSDRIRNRKSPAIFGYSTSAVSKSLLFLAGFGWYFILLSRFFDRVGKGIRTAPRDALISESVSASIHGKAFGFHRAMDFAGASLGVLICYFLVLKFLDPVTGNLKDLGSFYRIFIWSIFPAFMGVCFLFFIQEAQEPDNEIGHTEGLKPNLNLKTYPPNLQRLFLSQMLFTLGNSSNQFLLLRTMDLGRPLSEVILMYFAFNLSCTVSASFFGSLSDRIGRKKVLLGGYGLYAVVYLSFGFITAGNRYVLWVFWVLYGIYCSMTEGNIKAFVADLSPGGSKATALGFLHTISGLGLLPASVIAGILFSWQEGAPFVFGGGMAILSMVVLARVPCNSALK
ncbi:MAG: MFS transporter [Proteobacteria bacterium]|nr:MFS transporter [Pseudomonadota bacterium]MBU4472286.1 MFS transporter [Pseudomonadota bacterium]MCG2751982.1 MFS transporter [Desulfobacteraceae bacterium]